MLILLIVALGCAPGPAEYECEVNDHGRTARIPAGDVELPPVIAGCRESTCWGASYTILDDGQVDVPCGQEADATGFDYVIAR